MRNMNETQECFLAFSSIKHTFSMEPPLMIGADADLRLVAMIYKVGARPHLSDQLERLVDVVELGRSPPECSN